MTTETTTKHDPAEIMAEVARLAKSVRAITEVSQLAGNYQINPARVMPGDTMCIQNLEGASEVSVDGDNVIVRLKYEFRARREADGPLEEGTPIKSPAVRVSAQFRVVYEIPDAEPASEQVLQAFGETNGRLTVTPYWREWLSSCTSRAGLPPYVAPPLNIAKRLASVARQAATESESSSE